MTDLIKIRGLSRQRIRVGGAVLSNTTTRVVDLDSGTARRDLAHHSAIGQYIVVGDTPGAIATGVVASSGTTLSYSVTAGTLLVEGAGTITVNAVSNVALTAADATNPRIDLIQVDMQSGAISKKDGTAAATPFAPVVDDGKLPIATFRVAANATTSAGVTITDKGLRL